MPTCHVTISETTLLEKDRVKGIIFLKALFQNNNSNSNGLSYTFNIPENEGKLVQVCVKSGNLSVKNCHTYETTGNDMSVSLSSTTSVRHIGPWSGWRGYGAFPGFYGLYKTMVSTIHNFDSRDHTYGLRLQEYRIGELSQIHR